jgi:hypothetical protein
MVARPNRVRRNEAVGSGIVSGVLEKTRISPEVLDHPAGAITFCESQAIT